MALKKIVFLFLFFLSNVFPKPEFHDFRYEAEAILKKDQSIVETLTDIVSESQIETEIQQLRTFLLQDKTVSSIRVLKDRVANDVALIHKKAHVLGFYGAKIEYKINADDYIRVKICIDLGKKFNLKLNVHYINQDEEFNKFYTSILQKDLRRFKASVEEIKSLINVAINNLQRNGFFKPEVIEKKVHLNYAMQEATLNLIINTGPKVFFSNVEIKSFPDIDDDFVRNRIAWEEGDVFNIDKMESTAENLRNTQIFSKVKIKPNEKSIQNDKIPMTIELQEDKKHTIDISLLYSAMRNMNFEKKSQTQKRLKSIIARLSWTNCNAFGGGEKLKFLVEGTPMKAQEKRSDYAFEATVSQPDIFLKNNTVDYCIARRQELTNVFFKKSDHMSIKFNYPIVDYLLMRMGVSTEKNYVDTSEIFFRNKNNKKEYDNFSIPLEFVVDKTDDWLNPTSGYRVTTKFSEIFFKRSTIGKLKTFDANFSYNHSLDDLKRTVLAFNVSRKSIFGQKIDVIPVDKRIYAGGMSSVRGFANQMATEMVVGEDIPMGGKSSVEFNTEIRRRISEDFGGVVFFDGAKVFQNKSCYNDLQTERKRWFCSVGIGVRYFTGVGPIRADFAFPIKRRGNVDSKVQFIMSLGQAF